MSNILEVHNVSKQYRLGTVGTGTLSHDLNRWFHKIRGKEDPYLKIGSANDRSTKADSDYVWALQDISFNVKEGEVLGIIGKNGAGKSTLLKILSRVTGPTTGSIKAYGRIASLLEVGTGFHPELTGRENIYLNGAILGMSKAEIRSKFDEIVDFSGCERYIDTPVKRYSSGMYVRLAFAVAAHLEPEILIVDEVLAVGDAEFQKKALGKMKDISTGQGRTVLFVSHNMAAVQSLCNNCVLMENGKISSIGKTEIILNKYVHNSKNDNFSRDLTCITKRSGSGTVKFSKYSFLNESYEECDVLISGKKSIIELELDNYSENDITNFHISIQITVNGEINLIHLNNSTANGKEDFVSCKSKKVKFRCTIPQLSLPQGGYMFNLFCSDLYTIFDTIENAGIINVEEGDFFETGKSLDSKLGLVYIKNNWLHID